MAANRRVVIIIYFTMVVGKCVAVGDHNVGKSALLITRHSEAFPLDYVPKTSEVVTVKEDNGVCLGLWDTREVEFGYSRLRPLSYPGTDVFLICYSVVERNSFTNAAVKWQEEVSHHCPGVPFVLVGTKLDLRDDSKVIASLRERNLEPVSFEEGLAQAQQMGATAYCEVSSITYKGVRGLFRHVSNITLREHVGSRAEGNCLVL